MKIFFCIVPMLALAQSVSAAPVTLPLQNAQVANVDLTLSARLYFSFKNFERDASFGIHDSAMEPSGYSNYRIGINLPNESISCDQLEVNNNDLRYRCTLSDRKFDNSEIAKVLVKLLNWKIFGTSSDRGFQARTGFLRASDSLSSITCTYTGNPANPVDASCSIK
jgi:hypothetical protein